MENSRLKVELEDSRKVVAALKERKDVEKKEEDGIKLVLKEKNIQLDKYITEITVLAENNAQLTNDVDILSRELEVCLGEVEGYVY